jgi:REP element-mobilizing transposase RayT
MLLPGTTYLVTRTTVSRQFLLAPDKRVNEIIEYCLARALRGLHIELHALSVQRNHYHLVLTDFAGDLPKFMRELNRMIAKCLLAMYRSQHPGKTLETIWSTSPYSAVALTTPASVLEKIAYTLTNPVKDGRVADYRAWAGVCSQPSDWLRGPKVVARPPIYFSQSDSSLASLRYQMTVPPMLRDLPAQEAVAAAEERILEHQSLWQRERQRTTQRPVTVRREARANRFEGPARARPGRSESPHFAASGVAEALDDAKRALRQFHASYRTARALFINGLPGTFPAGTYLMRVVYQVPCEHWIAPWCAAALAIAARAAGDASPLSV